MFIDSHQHFWRYSPTEHAWMTPAMSAIQRDFLPSDLKPLLAVTGFERSIAVQARQSLEETRWLLQLADHHESIAGVVGWVDLCSDQAAEQLAEFARCGGPRGRSKLVGVRHVVHDEPDDRFMLRAEFRRGVGMLSKHRLTYDLLLFPRHLPIATALVDEFVAQPFVVDHLAKPPIASGELNPWVDDLRELARRDNTYCKLSGMATEADWRRWQPSDFVPYLDAALEVFGPDRLMIGSDWPVCTLAGDYETVMGAVLGYVERLAPSERTAILGTTCRRFYRLEE
ncbi:MAG: amidohydrolase family protein [Planctomycetales bacterium]|nr:amidohydrolase family protein [Planctomycetales bacterium]